MADSFVFVAGVSASRTPRCEEDPRHTRGGGSARRPEKQEREDLVPDVRIAAIDCSVRAYVRIAGASECQPRTTETDQQAVIPGDR